MTTFILNPWTYKYIRQRAEQATIEARQQDLRPATADEAARNYKTSERFNLPFLGDYVPDGWERDQSRLFFVEMVDFHTPTTWLSRWELYQEITRWQFKNTKSIGLAVVEHGQYMAVVAVYQRKEAHGNKKEES